MADVDISKIPRQNFIEFRSCFLDTVNRSAKVRNLGKAARNKGKSDEEKNYYEGQAYYKYFTESGSGYGPANQEKLRSYIDQYLQPSSDKTFVTAPKYDPVNRLKPTYVKVGDRDRLTEPKVDNYVGEDDDAGAAPAQEFARWENIPDMQRNKIIKVIRTKFKDYINTSLTDLTDEETYYLFVANASKLDPDEYEELRAKLQQAYDEKASSDDDMKSIATAQTRTPSESPLPAGESTTPTPEKTGEGGLFAAAKRLIYETVMRAGKVDKDLTPAEKFKINMLAKEGFTEDAKFLDEFIAANPDKTLTEAEYIAWRGKATGEEADIMAVHAKQGEDEKCDTSQKKGSMKTELPSRAVGPYVKAQELKEQRLFTAKMSSIFTKPNYKIEPMNSKLKYVQGINTSKVYK